MPLWTVRQIPSPRETESHRHHARRLIECGDFTPLRRKHDENI
jgi:hypothetical protein